MADRIPRFGEDTWYGVVGYEGDPHILAYRREHPEHVTVPLRWRVPPRAEEVPGARGPRGAPGQWRAPRPMFQFTAEDPPSVKEFMALGAALRAGGGAGPGAPEVVLAQWRRGGIGRPLRGADGRWTGLPAREQAFADRYAAAVRDLRVLEPRNPQLSSLTRPGAAPTEEMALELERELAAARVREGSGAPPRGSPPGTPGRDVRRVDPEDGPEPARYRPGVATASGPLPLVGEGRWLRGTEGNAGLIPAEIARRMEGRCFCEFSGVSRGVLAGGCGHAWVGGSFYGRECFKN